MCLLRKIISEGQQKGEIRNNPDVQNGEFSLGYYGEKKTATLHVRKNSDGIYEIPESDLTQIDSLLFPADSF